MRCFARALPLGVICELLGLPQEDRPRFTHWLESLADVASPAGIFRSLPATTRIAGYLRSQFERRRAVPGDDLVTALVQAAADGDRFTEDELLGMCFLLFFAGHETTTHWIGGGVLALLQNPHEPAGTEIQRAESVSVLIGAANSDPCVFHEPDRLNITREKNRHLSFGRGPHPCLGLQLTRLETSIALEHLFRRFPDLDLAIPESELPWQGRTGLRALTRLPLRLGNAR